MNDQEHDQRGEDPKRLNQYNSICNHEIYEDLFMIDGKQFYAEHCPVCDTCWPINNE